MCVYEISVITQKYGSSKNSSQSGIFLLNTDNTLSGCIETDDLLKNPVRYIYGMYHASSNVLAFFQLATTDEIRPIMYTFTNTKKSGIWSEYDEFNDLFFPAINENSGTAQVIIKELSYPGKLEYLKKQILKTFVECTSINSNRMLIYKGLLPYMAD